MFKVDADDEPDLMRSYEVATLPTLIMYYHGQVVGRSDGSIEEGELFDWVKAVENDVRRIQRGEKSQADTQGL